MSIATEINRITTEVSAQTDILNEIITVLQEKLAGGSSTTAEASTNNSAKS